MWHIQTTLQRNSIFDPIPHNRYLPLLVPDVEIIYGLPFINSIFDPILA